MCLAKIYKENMKRKPYSLHKEMQCHSPQRPTVEKFKQKMDLKKKLHNFYNQNSMRYLSSLFRSMLLEINPKYVCLKRGCFHFPIDITKFNIFR